MSHRVLYKIIYHKDLPKNSSSQCFVKALFLTVLHSNLSLILSQAKNAVIFILLN